MSEKDIDLDKILSESMSRLDKIGAGNKPQEKKDLSEVTLGPDIRSSADIQMPSDDTADDAPDILAEDIPVQEEQPTDNVPDDAMSDTGDEENAEDDDVADNDDVGGDYYDDGDDYSDEEEYPEDGGYDEDDEDEDFVEDYQDVSDRGRLQFNMRHDHEEKRRKRKKKRVKPNNSIFVGTLIAVIVISISFILSFLSIQLGVEYIGLTRSEDSITFDVPEGASSDTIADLLYQKGIIENPTFFRIVMRASGKTNIVPGSITLSPNMTYPSIITELNRSRKVYETVTVTFTEGITLYRAAKLLEENNVCTASDFLDAFNRDSGFDFEKEIEQDLSPQTLYMMEGFMFPDTYEFYVEDDPANVASKIKSNFEAKMDGDMMTLVEQSGMSLYDVITLASIVQAEADTTENMKMVASVFINRLANRAEYPNLQSDVTYYYVTNTIASALGNSAVSSYEYLYNTYSCYGLPIGPIGNPGLDAIKAVLQPTPTEYYYFVTDSVTGEFYYASTLEEHQENVKKAGY